MPDLSNITQNIISNQGAVALGANLILITPNANIGIRPDDSPDQSFLESLVSSPEKSILFDIVGEESVTFSTDVTDHYVEDNTAIQDHVAIKPVTITVLGYISELNTVVPRALQTLKNVADKLTVISPFVPALSVGAIIAYNQAEQAYRTGNIAVSAVKSVWNTIQGNGVQNNQQLMFTKIFNYFQNRQLFSVQTPWAIHKNMLLTSVRSVQTEETRMISEYELSFKQIRFVKNNISLDSIGSGRFVQMSSKNVDLGPSPTSPTTDTLSGKTSGIVGPQ